MLKATGYVDRWSGSAGETITVYASASEPEYRVELRRLIHGDPNPLGPGIKEELVDHPLNGTVFAGKEQAIRPGSCMIVQPAPDAQLFAITGSFQPTLLSEDARALLSLGTGGQHRLAIMIGADGLSIYEGDGERARLTMPLTTGIWYDFLLEADLGSGKIRFRIKPSRFQPDWPSQQIEAMIAPAGGLQDFCLGAASCVAQGRQWLIEAPYNGRVADLKLHDGPIDPADNDRWQRGQAITARLLADWRFVEAAGSESVPDRSGNGFDGRTINRPTRLVAGPHFEGQAQKATDAPDAFNAIHFHDDDLGDAGWEPSFTFTVPEDLRSGIYAFHLSCGDSTDYVPFFVTPAPGAQVAPVAVLVPTLSYQIYANMYAELDAMPPEESPMRDLSAPETPEEAYVRAHRLRSCYDPHSDGSGVCIGSMLRPMPIFVRPRSVGRLNNSQHQLSADLFLIDWLEARGIPYELLTDHQLHAQGTAALARFRTVLTGTHAEYWTAAMLDGLKGYTDGGGRFICLAGNCLYWATALSEDGSMAEVRRDHGLRSWTSLPGEAQLSLDGSMGGVWRNLGRAPNKYVGTGFASMGFDKGRPYTRTDASRMSRAAFLFDGIAEQEIGDFPALTSAYGAAGVEFDRADFSQGTPAHALILATASGFSDLYQLTVDEVVTTTRYFGGTLHPDVRADIVFYETPNGGAVFSATSISWCSALSYNGYDNSVSKLTENVVRCFMKERLPEAIAGLPQD